MPGATASARATRPELPRRGRATRAQDRPEQVRTAALELVAEGIHPPVEAELTVSTS